MSASNCGNAALVDGHFSGRGSLQQEQQLRTHLPDCERCRARYERHLLYAKLTGSGASPADRLARGLGFRAPSTAVSWRSPARWSAGALAAVTALVLLVSGV